MHTAHRSFYERYINLLNNELMADKSEFIKPMNIQPENIIPLCCQLPMWTILCKNTKDKIYMIFPSNIYKYYNRYIETFENIIKSKESIKIQVLQDPETGVRFFLYID